jgi:hypothetical protein
MTRRHWRLTGVGIAGIPVVLGYLWLAYRLGLAMGTPLYAQTTCPTLPGEVINGTTKTVVSSGPASTLAARAAQLIAQGWTVISHGGSAANPTILASCPVVPTTPPPTGGIAAGYPKDVGIAAHPAVVFTEEFEDSIAAVVSRWTDHQERTSYISPDVPAGSVAGSHAIAIPRTATDTGGHFFKGWGTNYPELYVRYYLKTTSHAHHVGVWIGGENVGSGGPRFPDPHAGAKPCRVATGECAARSLAAWFWTSAEPDDYDYFNSYTAFLNMHPDGNGTYWGDLLATNKVTTLPLNTWTCVEQRVKLNQVGNTDGEYTIWFNGVQLVALGKGFPPGSWSGGIFTPAATGTAFEGLEWRDTTAFGINYVWLQNYTDGPLTNTVWFDHLVVATQRIGCLAP